MPSAICRGVPWVGNSPGPSRKVSGSLTPISTEPGGRRRSFRPRRRRSGSDRERGRPTGPPAFARGAGPGPSAGVSSGGKWWLERMLKCRRMARRRSPPAGRGRPRRFEGGRRRAVRTPDRWRRAPPPSPQARQLRVDGERIGNVVRDEAAREERRLEPHPGGGRKRRGARPEPGGAIGGGGARERARREIRERTPGRPSRQSSRRAPRGSGRERP